MDIGEFGTTGSKSADLYVVDMREGLTRVQALRRLTAVAAGSFGAVGRVEPIRDLGISPDGTEIAFSSSRTVFPLGSPEYVSPSAATSSVNEGPVELYDVDLANDTLTRVTRGFAGEPTAQLEGSAAANAAPSFTEDGNVFAFASVATNLAFGDGNGASDVFLARRKRFDEAAAAQNISPAPSSPSTEPDWLLDVTARSRRDGSVVLEVAVPGAGSLSAAAQSSVPTRARRRAHNGRVGAGRRTSATRTVATAARAITSEGIVAVRLLPGPRYRALALRRGGLEATVRVVLQSTGHARLRQDIAVTFLRRARASTHGRHRRR